MQVDGSSIERNTPEELLCEINCDENLDDDVTSDSNVVLCEEYLMNGNIKLVRREKSKIIVLYNLTRIKILRIIVGNVFSSVSMWYKTSNKNMRCIQI